MILTRCRRPSSFNFCPVVGWFLAATLLVPLSSPFVFGQGPTITFVQSNYADPQTPQTTVTVPYTAAQTAGNLNVIVVGWNDSTTHVQSISDTKLNAYTLAGVPTVQSGTATQAIYFAKNIAAAAAGGNAVTVTFDAGARFPDIRIAEYSGLDAVNPLDVVVAATGTSTTSNSGAVTTTNVNDLLVGANVVQTTTTGAGAGYTSRVISNPDGGILEDRVVTAVGSYSATAPVSPSGAWLMQMVAFRAASGGGGGDTQAPTTPTNLTATAVSSSQINLSWTASTDNVGVTSYLIERCQGAGCSNFAQIATSTVTTYNNSGLTASTNYSYRVRATDAANNLSPYSNTASDTTQAADTQPPTDPTNLVATAVSGSQINLSWTASTDNVAVTNYFIERCQAASCANFAQVATSATTAFNNTGLAASTSYSYRVRATDAANNLSLYSNTATATTQVGAAAIVYVQSNYADPQTPQTTVTVPYTAAQTAGNLNVIVVGWNDSTTHVQSISDTKLNAYTLAGVPTVQSGTATQAIYFAKNIAAAAAGGNAVTVTFDAGARFPDIRIAEYSGLDAVNPLDVVVAATGTSATSNSGAVTTTNANDLLVGANVVQTATTGAGTSYTSRLISNPDRDILEDRVVTAVGSYSATAPVSPSGAWLMQMVAFRAASGGGGGDTQAPTTPANLTATAVSSSQINLSWTASTDNVAVANYLVERCQGNGCSNFAQVATSATTTFNNTGLTASTSYSYRVRATDAANNLSSYSNTASDTTQLPDTQVPTAPTNLTATATSSSQINLSWTASTDNVAVTSYFVEQCQGNGCSNFAQIASTAATEYNNTGLAASTNYSYRVRATDAANNLSGYSNTTSVTTPGTSAIPAYIQGNYAVPQTPQTVVTVPYTGAQTAGNLNVVVVGWSDTTAQVQSIADTKGNAYLPAVGPTLQSGTATQTIYYAANIAAAATNGNTVTVRFSTGARFPDIRIAEYSGIDPANPLDVVIAAVGISTTSNSGSVTTTNPVDLLVGANVAQTATVSAGTGYTNRAITVPDRDILEDRVVTTAESYSATASISPSGAWLMQMVAFRGTASPPPPDTTPPSVTVTSPLANATVSGTITLAATATDNLAVQGVQFQIDGSNVGAPVTSAPYQISWDTSTFANALHSISAYAWDAAKNFGSSSPVTVQFTNANPKNPAQVGVWSGTLSWPLVAIHTNLLPNGKVLMWDQMEIGPSDPQLWDPATGAVTPVPLNDGANIFCAGHAQLPDGGIIVVGGHNHSNFVGLTITRVFDPVTNTWSSPPDMTFGRWYPSATAMPDGRVLVFSGAINCDGCNADTPEIFNPTTNSWTALTNAAITLPLYPYMYVLPDGRIINIGSYEAAVATRVLNVATQTWTTVDSALLNGGSAAMYLPGKFIKSGLGTRASVEVSNTPSAATTYLLDMNQANPSWRQTASMAFQRDFHTLTILPDGKVLVTGGGTTIGAIDVAHAVLPAEVWDPVSESWTTMAPMHSPRLYHSTAVLLPDARVLVTGGGRDSTVAAPATDQLSAEVYSPPYLFQGVRPTITSAPSTALYGQTMTIQTPDASRIAKVVVVRLSSVTHAFNWNQRYVPLSFTVGSGTITATSPINANLAPPGYYMLFLVDTNGVPSVAAMVRF